MSETITRANAQSWGSGTLLQTTLNEKVLQNFEPSMYFYGLWEKPMWSDKTNTMMWARFGRLLQTPAQSILTEWVTPSNISFDASTITMTATQYGMYVTLADMLVDKQPINFILWAGSEIGKNMGRIIDTIIQDNLLSGNINTLYGGDATSRATIDATDVLTGLDLVKADTFLTAKASPRIDGYYLGVFSQNVIYDLRIDTDAKGWLEANKYVTPEKIFKGEIGALNGIRVMQNPFVRPLASTVTVYPNFFFGAGSFWVSEFQSLKNYITPRVSSDSDPLAQRVKVGSKVAFWTVILNNDSLLIIETSASVNYVSDFNPAPQ